VNILTHGTAKYNRSRNKKKSGKRRRKKKKMKKTLEMAKLPETTK
jgi:hypothetical protein